MVTGMALAKFAVADALTEVIIVGGGASGTLMAFHLLRDPAADVRVTLVERRPQIGRGVAYAATNPDHLLNVPAGSMSAVADEPDHFCRWLRARAGNARSHRRAGSDVSTFVPRAVYGDYLASLNAPFVAQGGRPGRLRVVRGECVSIEETRSGVAIALADGSRQFADLAILATGHELPGKFDGCHVDPWSAPAEAGVDRDDRVLIVGTGLTMIDYVLSLGGAGHRGPIVAMSRRGLLPLAHRSIEPLRIDRAEFRSAPARRSFSAGCAIASPITRRAAAIGAACSKASDPITRKSGSACRPPRGAAFSGTPGRGGTFIVTAWRRKRQRLPPPRSGRASSL